MAEYKDIINQSKTELIYEEAKRSVGDLHVVIKMYKLPTDKAFMTLRDRVETLYSMTWECTEVDMMHRAVYHRATKCFKAILTKKKLEEWGDEALTSLFYTCATYDFSSLNEMVNYGYREVNSMRLINGYTPLMAAVMPVVRYPMIKRYRCPIEMCKNIELLLSLGAHTSATKTVGSCYELDFALEHAIEAIHYVPIYCNSKLRIELDSARKMLLHSVAMLLDARKEEQGENLPVSLLAVCKLHEEFLAFVHSITRRSILSNKQVSSVLGVYIEMLEMLLKANVNLRDKQQCRISGLNPSTGVEEYFASRCRNYLEESLGKMISTFGRNGMIFKFVRQYYTLLITYGHQPDIKWCVLLDMIISYQPTALLPLVHQVLSVMDKEIQEEVCQADRVGIARLARIDYRNSVTIRTNFYTLQELSRRTIYKCIKDGRVAAHVDKLEITKPAKNFLLFR